MPQVHIVERPAFRVAGSSTYISGQDNEQFGRFWQQCSEGGLMETFARLTGFRPGPVSGATSLGISRVEKDPARRDFDYWIAVEVDAEAETGELQTWTVPAATWAVFDCIGPLPEALVASEMYCFMEWLPQSGYAHDQAPELEVYLPDQDGRKHTQFWLPIRPL